MRKTCSSASGLWFEKDAERRRKDREMNRKGFGKLGHDQIVRKGAL